MVLAVVLGCEVDPVVGREPDRGPEPPAAPAPATLRRLTTSQYVDTVNDLFGEGLVLPTSLEPDLVVDGLLAVGAGQVAISPLGVEQYESAAYLLAEQVVADPERRAALVPCEPAGVTDDLCADAFVRSFGRLAWRRPLTDEEAAALVVVANAAAGTLGDFWSGLSYALAGLLQSPHFLYRVEIGLGGSFTDHELASRTSYLLWNGPPDEELLDLADEGRLADADERRAQVERMLADPRARRGVRTFFDEMLGLWELDALTKDPTVFVHWSDQVGPSAREETLAVVEDLAFGRPSQGGSGPPGDLRDLLITRSTHLDRTLAAIYAVPAPTLDGFAAADLPADGPRAGLLGQVSFLAREAHPVSTSVTRRGQFVRETLLCQVIPPPPANVDTSIPEPSPDLPTMRDRVAVHLEDPVCASCHQITDPVGLALEHFDGIGLYRETDGGYAIDASGELDGEAFDDALGLAWAVRNHPDLARCFATTALRYAQGHALSEPEEDLAAWHTQGFAAADHAWPELLADLVASEAFALAGEAP